MQPPPAEPDELLEQMRLHRLLVDLVLELEEPWSDTGSVARHGAMKAVDVIDAPPMGTVTLIAPTGLRIEGVSIEAAIAILRGIA